MTLGYDKGLYILAFDHRGSFQKKFFGIEGAPNAEETARIADAKRVIFEGFKSALASGAPKETAGILVDEQFGAEIVREAKSSGLLFAMPVEKSGQDEFDFEYGEDFGKHIEEFDPVFSKVLVRYNPEGDQDLNLRQTEKLSMLGDWLHERGRKFLFELLVPAEKGQLEQVDGDAGRYDCEIRPSLMRETVIELQAAGVDPDIWKIEGIDERADCETIAAAARSGGRDGVICVVLGRGADDAAVDHWLQQGAGVPGYDGFAIGRTIWWDPLMAFVKGEKPREEAAAEIGANYSRFIDVYAKAAG
jgi:myo-inositol catabolism protein IolC